MAVRFTNSADKRGIPRADSLYAMIHPDVTVAVDGRLGETTMLYIGHPHGHPHGQTERYIEVIAAHRPPNSILLFHAMPLRGIFAHLLEEGNNS